MKVGKVKEGFKVLEGLKTSPLSHPCDQKGRDWVYTIAKEGEEKARGRKDSTAT